MQSCLFIHLCNFFQITHLVHSQEKTAPQNRPVSEYTGDHYPGNKQTARYLSHSYSDLACHLHARYVNEGSILALKAAQCSTALFGVQSFEVFLGGKYDQPDIGQYSLVIQHCHSALFQTRRPTFISGSSAQNAARLSLAQSAGQ